MEIKDILDHRYKVKLTSDDLRGKHDLSQPEKIGLGAFKLSATHWNRAYLIYLCLEDGSCYVYKVRPDMTPYVQLGMTTEHHVDMGVKAYVNIKKSL